MKKLKYPEKKNTYKNIKISERKRDGMSKMSLNRFKMLGNKIVRSARAIRKL